MHYRNPNCVTGVFPNKDPKRLVLRFGSFHVLRLCECAPFDQPAAKSERAFSETRSISCSSGASPATNIAVCSFGP
jgi:hypothetical protein